MVAQLATIEALKVPAANASSNRRRVAMAIPPVSDCHNNLRATQNDRTRHHVEQRRSRGFTRTTRRIQNWEWNLRWINTPHPD
jgi:hypothetical protein